MSKQTLTQAPVAKAEMLIRRPLAEVFEAFVDPAVTTQFWFSKSSGRLAAGKDVQWEWESFGLTLAVRVVAVEMHRRIAIEWGDVETPSTVEWIFSPRGDKATFVSISNRGFQGDADAAVAEAIGSTEGFTIVLAGAKALLEHKLQLNLVADRFPDGLG